MKLNFEVNLRFAKLTLVQEIEKDQYYSSLELPEEPTVPVEPTPDNPPWNSGVAVAVWVLSVALIVIVPSVFAVIYVLSKGLEVTEELGQNPDVQFVALTSIVPVHILTLIVALLVVTRRGKFSLDKTLGFESGGYRWWHYLSILAGLIGMIVVVTRFFPEQENEMTRLLNSSRAAVYLVAIIATISAPFVEEIVYRGLLYSAIQRRLGKLSSIAIVTSLFAGVHFFQYWGSPGTIILIVILSLILTLMRSRAKNLLPCIILHTLFNGIQSLLLVLGTMTDSLDSPPDPGFVFHLFK